MFIRARPKLRNAMFIFCKEEYNTDWKKNWMKILTKKLRY